MKRNQLLALCALLVGLGACDTRPHYSVGPGFGDATLHNMAVQIINPDPNVEEEPAPVEGVRSQQAIDKYNAGKVEKATAPGTGGG